MPGDIKHFFLCVFSLLFPRMLCATTWVCTSVLFVLRTWRELCGLWMKLNTKRGDHQRWPGKSTYTHTISHTFYFFFSCFTVQVDVSVSLWVLALWLLKWTLYYNQEANSAIRLKRKKRKKKRSSWRRVVYVLSCMCVCFSLFVDTISKQLCEMQERKKPC